MRRCSILAAAGTLLLATSLWGAGSSRATIPFPFHVGEAELTAGDYDVIVGRPHIGAITIRSCSTGEEFFTPNLSFDRQQDLFSPEAKLVFNQYGENEYFLSQIWDPSHPYSMKLVKSQHEVVTSKLTAALRADKVVVAMRVR